MTVFDQMAELVHERCGFAPTQPLMASLRRAAAHHCVEMGGISYEDYLALLMVSPEELASLIRELIVPETFFFRYPESFAALVAWVRQRGRPLRVLSLACSTGEEAYTIAITLLEENLALTDFVVEGWDLNPHSIEVAKKGLYAGNSFRADPGEWRDRYFVRRTGGWQARTPLREAVQFKQANLLEVTDHARWDVIFCRNVLIYFSSDQQRKAGALLDRALIEEGVLFLGPAEPPIFLDMDWMSAPYPMSFACVRKPRSQPVVASTPARSRATVPKKTPIVSPTPLLAKKSAPVAVPKEAPILAPLDRARLLADEGRLREAHQLLTELLRKEPEGTEANLLMGVVEEALGHVSAAESHYRRVLFLNPSHLEALQHMKLLLRNQGREQAAERLGRRVARHKTA